MKAETLTIMPGQLTLAALRQILLGSVKLQLHKEALPAIHASTQTVAKVLADEQVVYGINTGFGLLANTRISASELTQLQKCLVLSHATGTGEYLNDESVRLILALKINSLARGYSAVRLEVIQALLTLYNEKIYPCIPAKGSVGASGDLAPLAHLSAVLLGVGEVRVAGKILSAKKGLALAGLKPLALAPKEGLALLNGTQVSTALALVGLLATENIFTAALVAGALSVDAALGSDVPFDARIHQVRGHNGQIKVASVYRKLLKGSRIRASHRKCGRVQDPYSLRCQPQVMGSCLDHIKFVANTLLIEANAVSDNPLVFSKDSAILSGGNFHAEPVAMAADALAVSIAEIGSLSERRTALLIDPHMSGLPAFLVENAGVNSGFMIAQVTAAALASENKSLAHPASVDSIPTSANQEDHVSMATYAARRLSDMTDNTAGIVAIELLAAAQGVNYRAPLATSPLLQQAVATIREIVPHYDRDRYFAPDIAAAKDLVKKGAFLPLVENLL